MTDHITLNRRCFLNQSATGLGSVALASLLHPELFAAEKSTAINAPGIEGLPHFPPKIKRVIYLYMSGGPSQFETFDYKPKLAEMDGQAMPESITAGQPIAQLQGQMLKCLGPQTKFQKYGQSGQEVSDFLPWTAKVADDIAIIRSMTTDQINHDPAHTLMNTGTSISGRPSMGSWSLYGLGSEGQDLPGFIVLTSEGGRNPQPISSRQWHSGFLPGRHQGVLFYSKGDAVHYLRNPDGISDARQRRLIDSVRELNSIQNEVVHNPEIDARIASYEMAFRMQTSVPELTDLSNEPQHVLDMYGAKGADGSFAANCLLARRMAERGVRFIQLYHRDWDHHGDLVPYMNTCCGLTDKPTWALINDLKQRGMLKDTLLVWGGEFGRTPMSQGKGKLPGRDHHIKGFSMWMCGGGIKGGVTHGATDEFGYNAVDNVCHVRDIHATLLHLFGIDHRRFTFKHQGLDFKLTGVVPAKIIQSILS